MLLGAIYGMIVLGSALMVYNIYSYIRFSKRLQEKDDWGRERKILNIPIVLLVMFLFGYIAVGVFGKPDLIVSGILFGGSIFVFVICTLMQRITDRVQESERLKGQLMAAEQSSQAKTRFLSTMSHEMRTPLNAVLGLSDLAGRDASLRPETRRQIEQISISSRHLMGLINNILDMNDIESGKMELKEEPFSLRETLELLDVITRNQCDEKGLTYTSSTDGPLDDLYMGDGLKLKEALLNILDNAVKFTPAPGAVTFTVGQIAAEGQTRTLRFTVRDTGVGIAESLLPNLFTPFTQEDDSNTSAFGGSGLSLAVSRKIVKLMGGDIAVESAKGKGSVFTVTVPLNACEKKVEPPPGDEAETSLGGRHVLIAEDIDLNAELLADLLDLEGVTSDRAENGQVAVDMFAASAPGAYDAILMDLRMPVMDGLDAARAIRALDRPDAKTVPILALTANAFEEDVRNSLEAGMNIHLAKPVETDILFDSIKHLIAQRRNKAQ